MADLQPGGFLGGLALSKFPSSNANQVPERTFVTAISVPSSLERTEEPSGDTLSWQRRRDLNAEEISKLQEKIKDARRLAVIGNARLNKWRNRYSSIR